MKRSFSLNGATELPLSLRVQVKIAVHELWLASLGLGDAAVADIHVQVLLRPTVVHCPMGAGVAPEGWPVFQNDVPYFMCRYENEQVVALRKDGTWGAPANSGDFFSFVTLGYPNYSQDGTVVTLRRRHPCTGNHARAGRDEASRNWLVSTLVLNLDFRIKVKPIEDQA